MQERIEADQFDIVVSALGDAKTALIIAGTGLGRESGLPTLQDETGAWVSSDPFGDTTLEGFRADPERRWSRYNRVIDGIVKHGPGRGHRAIVALGKLIPDFTLATHEVDGLQRLAGSERVIELMGSLHRTACLGCGHISTLGGRSLPLGQIRHDCGEIVRPDIAWRGEGARSAELALTREAARRCDVLLAIGTGSEDLLDVEPFTRTNALVVEIAPYGRRGASGATVSIMRPIGEALPDLVRGVRAQRKTEDST